MGATPWRFKSSHPHHSVIELQAAPRPVSEERPELSGFCPCQTRPILRPSVDNKNVPFMSNVGGLRQQLKELDPTTFEQLCFHLLKARHPGAEIHHVHGAGGDEGVDVFVGNLAVGATVWQCKAFPNGVGKSQQQKIRASLQRAIEKVRPSLWVLCTSVDLSTSAHRWWQKLQQEYAAQVRLELVSASEIIEQLTYRRALRETFFPNVILDVAVLRSALARSSRHTMGGISGSFRG